MDVAAVILAAGYSSRMGFFKPIAALNGVSALERILRSMSESGVQDVLVVTGFRGDEVALLAQRSGARAVFNPRFAEGMFTSVQAGVAALPPSVGAFFLLPVDIPTVRASTMRMMLQHASSGGVLHPVFRGVRGHPPLIGASLVPQILNFSGSGGLRAFFDAWKAWTLEIRVADEGVLMDMDTPEDYDRLCRRSRSLRVPSKQERLALFDIAGTPRRVRRHCEATASVCLAIGIALKQRGIRVDLPLLHGAALLHDICKHLPDHVRAGEAFLGFHGFPVLAGIVACHRDLPSSPRNEAAILHLADKIVSDTSIVSLDDRKKSMRSRYGTDKDAWSVVRERYADARRTIRRIERSTGRSLEDLLHF